MRHLSTEELLLYAAGELEDRGLCRHVSECVDCKAELVDLQETFVIAASDLLAGTPAQPAAAFPVSQLRSRLESEAELLSTHLSVQDLLLSVEGGLSAKGRTHLEACPACQDRAAELHVQLAEIESELAAQTASEIPSERRAAALAALRVRLQGEMEVQRAKTKPSWDWRAAFRIPRMPAFGSFAAAAAAACLLVWIGLPESGDPVEQSRPSIAELGTPREQPPVTPAVETPAESTQPAAPARFELPELTPATAARRPGQLPPPSFDLLATAGPAVPVPVTLPSAGQLPPPTPDAEPLAAYATPASLSVPVPGRLAASSPESSQSALMGSWMLIKAGLWNQALRPGGSEGRIVFTGSAASESARKGIEGRLLAAADGWPIEFDISVQRGAASPGPARGATAAPRGGIVGGPVRNSLLRHIDDSARRQFQPMDGAARENELNRYVTQVLRDEAELLARAHALHSALNRSGIDELRGSQSLRRVVRSHLDAIDRREDAIHGNLSEALEPTYWRHRNHKAEAPGSERLGAMSRDMLRAALELDRKLTSMFFAGSGVVDARESNLSVETVLARIRQHSRRLRAATR